MAIRDLLPVSWGRRRLPIRRESSENPFLALQREMNRLFDTFFGEFSPATFGESMGSFYPRVEVRESNKEIKVIAELPGLDEKDIDITIQDDVLILRGEKREEKTEEGEYLYYMERSYGTFYREIPLPVEVDSNRAEAVFKKGVLTVRLPKKVESERGAKKIPVKVL